MRMSPVCSWGQSTALLKIGCEHLGIDRAFDQEGELLDAVMTQGRNESGTLPVAMRDGVLDTTLAQRTAAIVAGQLGIQAALFHQ